MQLKVSAVRAKAKRHGYLLWKQTKAVGLSRDNKGQYMLVDTNNCNAIVLGLRFDATLQEVDDFLEKHENG